MWLLYAGIDGVGSAGNVPLLRAINNAGIRRPLMKNDQPNGIYLKYDQRLPLQPHRTHYYPRPPLPPRQQQHKQQPGFVRNSKGRHPPRSAPVSTHNHLELAVGNPGRGKLHQHFINQRQQPLKQHPNHQFRTVNMPTNVHHPHNKQSTNNHQSQQPLNHQNLSVRRPSPVPPKNPYGTSLDESTVPNQETTMLQDAKNLLTLQVENGDYLMYLYLTTNETRLEEANLTPATAVNAGDMMTHPPSHDDDIIIGAPSVHFDPYLSQNQSFRLKATNEQNKANNNDHRKLSNEGGKAMTGENVIKSLAEDWLPILSPWDKYDKIAHPNK